MILSFFVYGTLKRGQCREQRWPAKPLSICPAWTKGQLYSRHDYPAMIVGDDRVIGELWTFARADIDRVVKVIDAVEGANQAGQVDLYRRVSSPIFDPADQFLTQAYLYLYGTDPVRDGFIKVIGPIVQWP